MKKGRRLTVGLSKRHICFLDRISKNCRFSEGRKLRRTAILRAFLRGAGNLDIDIGGVKSERELKERILESFKKFIFFNIEKHNSASQKP